MSQNVQKPEASTILAVVLVILVFGLFGSGFIVPILAVLIKLLWVLMLVGLVAGLVKWLQTKGLAEQINLDILDKFFGSGTCPNCNTKVKKDFAYCPHCQAALKATCPGCGKDLQEGWTYCPDCGATK